MDESGGLLVKLFIYLLVALFAVPVARRLGLGLALGYLLAGIVIGPWGLALIRDADHIAGLTRVATVMLFLLMALQASPERVERLQRGFGRLGLGQLVLTVSLITAIGVLIGHPWHHSLVAGIALSMASSAMALQTFVERYPTGSQLTDTGEQLLLTHTLMMVPVVILLPLLGFDAAITEGSAWPRVMAGLLLLAGVWLVSTLLLKPALRYIVNLGLDEVFAAFALVLVIGLLLLTESLSLPLELGALLGGLLLIRSEYGSAIQIATRPFAGLLVGLFFISAGMVVDFGILIRRPLETLALVALLVGLKIWILRNLLRYSAVARQQRIWLATVLSQGGELGLVVLSLAVVNHALPQQLADELLLVVVVSMMSTPLLLVFAERRDTHPASRQRNTGIEPGTRADSQVVMAGFGRVGQVIARLLKQNGYRVVIIDHNPDQFAALRAEGFAGFYGDALRPDLLEAAGATRASIMVIAIDDAERATELIQRVRREFPHMTIVSRAVDAEHRARLLAGGADRAYRETFETALLMGEDVLELIGVSPLDAQAFTESFRDSEESDGMPS